MGHRHPPEGAFRHEALFYEGDDEFVATSTAFLEDGIAAGEPALVVVSGEKIERLRDALGAEAREVQFADMDEVGRNPARIIPAWREFVDRHGGNRRSFRGIGEPVGPERRPAELDECRRHEALLNLAFAESPSWWLRCPYDTSVLDGETIEEARRTHPFLRHRDVAAQSPVYRDVRSGDGVLADPLPDPPPGTTAMEFASGPLEPLRQVVYRHAVAIGIGRPATADLLLAVTEVATNSLRHGGGGGSLRVWEEGGALVCEVRDGGHITQPLIGRVPPAFDGEDGRGLWLVNQLCDLVQIRSTPAGTTVRLHTWLRFDESATVALVDR